MIKQSAFLASLLGLSLATAVSAVNIIWVDEGAGGFADWATLLEAAGHTVTNMTNMGTLDDAKIAAMNEADLVIVSRDTNSGSYDDGDEIAQWNGLTVPIIQTSVYLIRSSRWQWANGTGTPEVGEGDTMLIVEDHPIFEGVGSAGDEITMLSNTTNITDVTDGGNGQVLATHSDGRMWITYWEAGTNFYNGTNQVPSGPRMWFGAVGNEASGLKGSVNLTDDGLTVFLRAIRFMTGTLRPAELASAPSPALDANDVPRDTVLSWEAGQFAAKHNVYFSMGLADVNEGSVGALVGEGLTDSTFDPGRLAFGQTYFWRVDEVNAAPDSTVFVGEVWNFTVEPFSLAINDITVTASSSFGVSSAENTINGAGMIADLHGTAADTMWISGGVPATIEYAFDRVYKLDTLLIWNSNQTIEPFVGFGAKDVVFEHSQDGSNWTVLEGTGPLAQAPGTVGYAANNQIDFAGAAAKHVRLTINSVHGFAPQASLSEVRFHYIPTFATRPSPAAGANEVAPDVTLSWGRDGREAGSHAVHVGTDPDALALAASVDDSSLATAALDLQLGQTYFWRVDEVNETMDPSTWTGDVWSFTTVGALVIDDMEGYADEEFKEIWASWVDGFDDPANGSLVGNGAAGTPETDRVHGGNQSLPMHYDNVAAAQSETTRTFAEPQDWTAHGVMSLVIHFEGSPSNSGGSLYVKINDTKIAYDGDASNLMRSGWNKWAISLADVAGTNLGRVTSLTVGIEGGGQGILYVDDVTLVSLDRELITPTEPLEGLAVHLPLDGDFQDASGNARHGTALGAPAFEAGASGQAVSLNGIDQYVEITGYQGVTAIDQVQQPFTISNWFKTLENGEMVTWGASPGGERLSWRIDGGSLRTEHGSGNLRGNTVANDGEWHHGALVVKEGAILRTTTTLLYIDGIEDSVFSGSDNPYNLQPDTDVRVGSRATSNDRFFPGAIDEVRIYDRALSAGEVAWLAGRTAAFDRP